MARQARDIERCGTEQMANQPCGHREGRGVGVRVMGAAGMRSDFSFAVAFVGIAA